MKKSLKVLILFLLVSACFGKKEFYSKGQMWSMAQRVDPNIELVIATKDEPAIQCNNYGEGCEFGFRVKHKNLTFVAVKYRSARTAMANAKVLGAYYKYNWLFDEVVGEKALEIFVVKAFKAEMANSGTTKD